MRRRCFEGVEGVVDELDSIPQSEAADAWIPISLCLEIADVRRGYCAQCSPLCFIFVHHAKIAIFQRRPKNTAC